MLPIRPSSTPRLSAELLLLPAWSGKQKGKKQTTTNIPLVTLDPRIAHHFRKRGAKNGVIVLDINYEQMKIEMIMNGPSIIFNTKSFSFSV